MNSFDLTEQQRQRRNGWVLGILVVMAATALISFDMGRRWGWDERGKSPESPSEAGMAEVRTQMARADVLLKMTALQRAQEELAAAEAAETKVADLQK